MFGPSVLLQEDFHMKMLAVVDDMLTLCLAGTVMTVPMGKMARIEYGSPRVVDVDDKNGLHVHCFHYHMEVESEH